MKNYFKQNKLNIIYSIVAVMAMLSIWIISYYAVGNDYLVPSFFESIKSFFECFTEGIFWVSFSNTILRMIIAVVISFVFSVVFAILSILGRRFSCFINTIIAVLRTLPTLAVVLIILVWSNPFIAPVVVTFLVVFPLLYSQITAAVGELDYGVIEMAKVYCIQKKDKLLKIYLPLISPSVFAQTGADISLAIKVMISAEVLANTYKSLGGLMQSSRIYLEMPRLAALTMVAVLLGLIIEFAFSQTEKVLFKWRAKGSDDDRD